MTVKHDTEKDNLIFSSGNTMYANLGIVGISETLDISEGYDGGIQDDYLTKEDMIELCDYMIFLWNLKRTEAAQRK